MSIIKWKFCYTTQTTVFAGNKLNDLKVSFRVYSYMFSKHLNECRVLSVECILEIICWTSFLFGFQYMLTSYLCFQTSYFISLINQIGVQYWKHNIFYHLIMIETFLCLFVLKIHERTLYTESKFIEIAMNNICDIAFLISGFISVSGERIILKFFLAISIKWKNSLWNYIILSIQTPFITFFFWQLQVIQNSRGDPNIKHLIKHMNLLSRCPLQTVYFHLFRIPSIW